VTLLVKIPLLSSILSLSVSVLDRTKKVLDLIYQAPTV